MQRKSPVDRKKWVLLKKIEWWSNLRLNRPFWLDQWVLCLFLVRSIEQTEFRRWTVKKIGGVPISFCIDSLIKWRKKRSSEIFEKERKERWKIGENLLMIIVWYKGFVWQQSHLISFIGNDKIKWPKKFRFIIRIDLNLFSFFLSSFD